VGPRAGLVGPRAGLVGPRAGLEGCEISRSTGIRSTDRPARSESLYRLSYQALNWSLYAALRQMLVGANNTVYLAALQFVPSGD
jgi:hypothetical protein